MAVQTLTAGGSLRLPMTYRAYLALGETKHHEYYDGMVVVNPPSRRHVVVARRLTRLLEDSAPAHLEVLPEWGWQAGPHAVLEPDVMVFRRAAAGDDVLREPPVVVVEVSSPSTRGEDRGRKRELYAAGGVGWYWLVDPDPGTVTVLGLGRGSAETRAVDGDATLRVTEPFAVTVDLRRLFAP